jgi:ABC-type microcin C transport system permease subunit YejB
MITLHRARLVFFLLALWQADQPGQSQWDEHGKHSEGASMKPEQKAGQKIDAQLVPEVERRLGVAQELTAVVFANLQRATRLRQSFLQEAFSGQLVLEEKAS